MEAPLFRLVRLVLLYLGCISDYYNVSPLGIRRAYECIDIHRRPEVGAADLTEVGGGRSNVNCDIHTFFLLPCRLKSGVMKKPVVGVPDQV